MIRRPPRSTRTYTLFPYTTLFRSPKFTEEKWFGRGIGVAVRKQDDDLKLLINDGIQRLIDNGKHAKIASKYFSYSIYE